MKSFFKKFASGVRAFPRATGAFLKNHKIISAVIVLAVIGAGYWGYTAFAAAKTTTQYVLSTAANSPIESTVTASGQVASSHELDLSPKASGTITSVLVSPGDTVKAGQLIATIDATDALKSLRDAQTNYQSAQISYTQSVTSANNTTTNGQQSLTTARDNGFDTTSSTESDLATITQGLTAVLYGKTDVPGYGGAPNINAYQSIIDDTEPTTDVSHDTAATSYKAAIDSYNQTFALYQAASRTSSPSDIEKLLASERDTVTKVNQAVKDSLAFYTLVSNTVANHDLLENPPSLAGQITTLGTYTSKASSDASSIASAQSSLTSAEQSVQSNTQSLSGDTPLSIQSAQLTLTKAQNSLQDARDTLADYSVTAPFAGTIGTVSLQKYDQASSGSKVATLITTQQYANLSLNETDIANIRVGQKAMLTFDAIEGLTMNGSVAEVDRIGTVSQGVATYAVKVGFDMEDPRVFAGMTANATIITASKDSALVVPTAAIKTVGTEKYVEVATPVSSTSNAGAARTATTGLASSTARQTHTGTSTRAFRTGATATGSLGTRTETVSTDSVTIRRVPVTTGIESDTMVEILNGLTPGEMVVTQSLNASGKTTTASKGLFSLFGGARATTGAAGGARTSTGAARGTTSTGSNTTFRAGGGAPPF